MTMNTTTHPSPTVCSFDLAHAIAVEHCSHADDSNLLLQQGWVLVSVGIDANGFPMFLLVESDGGGWGE